MVVVRGSVGLLALVLLLCLHHATDLLAARLGSLTNTTNCMLGGLKWLIIHQTLLVNLHAMLGDSFINSVHFVNQDALSERLYDIVALLRQRRRSLIVKAEAACGFNLPAIVALHE